MITQGERIISRLPYANPFLFVDKILSVNKDLIVGSYCFKLDEFFYSGHFVDNPVTPGVILLECMGQIGIVSHALYLEGLHLTNQNFKISLTDLKSEFFEPVVPNTTVVVQGRLKYMRAGKLRSNIRMIDANTNNLIVICEASGIIEKYG